MYSWNTLTQKVFIACLALSMTGFALLPEADARGGGGGGGRGGFSGGGFGGGGNFGNGAGNGGRSFGQGDGAFSQRSGGFDRGSFNGNAASTANRDNNMQQAGQYHQNMYNEKTSDAQNAYGNVSSNRDSNMQQAGEYHQNMYNEKTNDAQNAYNNVYDNRTNTMQQAGEYHQNMYNEKTNDAQNAYNNVYNNRQNAYNQAEDYYGYATHPVNYNPYAYGVVPAAAATYYAADPYATTVTTAQKYMYYLPLRHRQVCLTESEAAALQLNADAQLSTCD